MPHANLLLLPGLLEDADAFEQLIAGIADVAVTVAADLTRADNIPALAAEALKQAPDGPLLVAGHSMGGYVALEVMRQAPGRVQKLALLNTNARPDTPESTENRRRLMALADRDFEAVVTTLLPKLMTADHLKDPVLTGIIGAMALGTGKEAFKRQQAAIIGRIDSRPHLKDIRCPTVVVAARDDQLMPVAVLQEMADGIPGARLAIVEECGHMASLEQPDAVLAIVREWIKD
ncbi:MAG TPA: alpha/beta fold hydrolase [Usitatibacter sp.]|nr:alpha/beta fold hydrolase [Usitatibacter sp.]